MILGPNDPRAVTGAELEVARKNTEWWNAMLGIAPLTEAQQKAKDDKLATILDQLKEWGHDVDSPITVEFADGTQTTGPSLRDQLTQQAVLDAIGWEDEDR